MSDTQLATLQAQLQSASAAYQVIQDDLSNAVEIRQRLDAQLSENEQVHKEFTGLGPNNQVYKLIGPILVKQDQSEARANVEKRIEFIKGEIKRVETQLSDLTKKSEDKKSEVSRSALVAHLLSSRWATSPTSAPSRDTMTDSFLFPLCSMMQIVQAQMVVQGLQQKAGGGPAAAKIQA
ncbi:hypothetical protein BOTBODRAFT_104922 [Botryobasidium botryosum FD-172 SS1]|uniref:Prefoldin subunit 6 n=1 Tax=Botryobasidium botryosum (strain FD-172 SS1) TaxID=930990 RepID=A0A067MTV1_BOTB1|nr:hypothetical protein BOTBODRAFT_104922 [Botryobasidium botryosum FD-172 SS1]